MVYLVGWWCRDDAVFVFFLSVWLVGVEQMQPVFVFVFLFGWLVLGSLKKVSLPGRHFDLVLYNTLQYNNTTVIY